MILSQKSQVCVEVDRKVWPNAPNGFCFLDLWARLDGMAIPSVTHRKDADPKYSVSLPGWVLGLEVLYLALLPEGLLLGLRHALLAVSQNFSQRRMHFQSPIVVDESLFPESIHEQVDSGARCANHLSQHLVT
jgi:hypothetical protein